MRMKYTGFFLVLIFLCITLFGFQEYWAKLGPLPVRFPTSDQRFLKPFLDEEIPNREDYEGLVAYFQDGLVTYRESNRALVRYPGSPSIDGLLRDRVEGFTRVAPLLAVWLRNNPSPNSVQARQARQVLIDGITNGTDPGSPGYWGPIHDDDQLIVEASDFALCVWLLRDTLWPQLPLEARNNAVRWLLQVNGKHVPDNNWHLFVTSVNLVVESIGYQADMQNAKAHYARVREFYRGNGWFSDGPGTRFDYYNSWGIHYQLFWIDQIKPSWDHMFIANSLDDFAKGFQFLIGPEGFPVMGRSICYRTAIATPLILDQELEHPSVPPGVARRAMDATWRYFIRNGAVENGNITQGYCAKDARTIDTYIGPASCLWGLRSLIGVLYLARSAPFWTQPEEPLPVERSSYKLQFWPTGWTVIGIKPGVIVIEQSAGKAPTPLRAENSLLAFYDRWRWRAHRDDNEDIKYGLREYRSDKPFCGCIRSQ
jgi:hypothetical protein